MNEKFQKEDITEKQLQKITRDCIEGLNYLHQNGIIHRDIKPQNILFNSSGVAKLADFGVSAVVRDEEFVKGTEGTYNFMAPEMLSPEVAKLGYSGRATDI